MALSVPGHGIKAPVFGLIISLHCGLASKRASNFATEQADKTNNAAKDAPTRLILFANKMVTTVNQPKSWTGNLSHDLILPQDYQRTLL